MAEALRTYPGLYLHVAKLAGRGLARRWYLLLLALPIVWLMNELTYALAGTFGLAGGLVAAFVRAAAVSLLLFIGRGIIEHRKFGTDDLTSGLGAFLNDVMLVFFTLWIASLFLGAAAPTLSGLLWLAVLVMPTFEIVALTSIGGFGVFSAAFDFMRRDAPAWIVGQLPLVLLVLVWWGLRAAVTPLVDATLDWPVVARTLVTIVGQVPAALALAAFVYRGVLFLTLDGTNTRQRAERWGGLPSLR